MVKAVVDPFVSGVRGQETMRDQLVFPGIDCSGDVDMARQEYALSSEIRYQIQQFGSGHRGESGHVDFDNMDLTRALELVEESNQAWLRIPKVIRDRYQSWSAVERAAASGELDQLLRVKGPAADAGGSASGAGPSASDSAPVPPVKGG